jgi:hypothetical protein
MILRQFDVGSQSPIGKTKPDGYYYGLDGAITPGGSRIQKSGKQIITKSKRETTLVIPPFGS